MPLLTPKLLQRLREIVERHHAAFVVNAFGKSTVAPEVLKELEAAGLVSKEPGQALRDAYLYGHVMAAVENPAMAGWPEAQFQKWLARNPVMLSPVEEAAVTAANLRAATYCVGLGNTVAKDTGQLLIEADTALRGKLMGDIKDATIRNVITRQSVGQLKSALGWAMDDWSRDLDRIAVTEKHNALTQGEADAIERKDGPEARCFFRPAADACATCKRLHLGPDGHPRIFRLSQLAPAGANVKQRQENWVASKGSVHPHCACRLSRIPDGWGFNAEGQQVPGGEFGVEVGEEGLQKAMAAEDAHQEALRKALLEPQGGHVALHERLMPLRKGRRLAGRMKVHGMDVSLEHQVGDVRNWYDPHAKVAGFTTMKVPYGYLTHGTEGVDGDAHDVYVGPNPNAQFVYVVHQRKKVGKDRFGGHDEDKTFLAFSSAAEAKAAYHAHMNDPGFFGGMDVLPVEDFKRKVFGRKGEAVRGTPVHFPEANDGPRLFKSHVKSKLPEPFPDGGRSNAQAARNFNNAETSAMQGSTIFTVPLDGPFEPFVKSSAHESFGNRGIGNAKVVSDGAITHSGVTEANGNGKIPVPGAAVEAPMLKGCHHLEVGRVIVQPVPVDVMNNLVTPQGPAENTGHHMAMLQNLLATPRYTNQPVGNLVENPDVSAHGTEHTHLSSTRNAALGDPDVFLTFGPPPDAFEKAFGAQAGTHKYIHREYKAGHWVYEYAQVQGGHLSPHPTDPDKVLINIPAHQSARGILADGTVGQKHVLESLAGKYGVSRDGLTHGHMVSLPITHTQADAIHMMEAKRPIPESMAPPPVTAEQKVERGQLSMFDLPPAPKPEAPVVVPPAAVTIQVAPTAVIPAGMEATPPVAPVVQEPGWDRMPDRARQLGEEAARAASAPGGKPKAAAQHPELMAMIAGGAKAMPILDAYNAGYQAEANRVANATLAKVPEPVPATISIPDTAPAVVPEALAAEPVAAINTDVPEAPKPVAPPSPGAKSPDGWDRMPPGRITSQDQLDPAKRYTGWTMVEAGTRAAPETRWVQTRTMPGTAFLGEGGNAAVVRDRPVQHGEVALFQEGWDPNKQAKTFMGSTRAELEPMMEEGRKKMAAVIAAMAAKADPVIPETPAALQPDPKATPKENKQRALAVGKHLEGSRKDAADLRAKVEAGKLDEVSAADAQRFLRKESLMPVVVAEQYRDLGATPGAAHMALAIASMVGAKPPDSAEGRNGYMEGVRIVNGALARIRTVEDAETFRTEIDDLLEKAGKYSRPATAGELAFTTHDFQARRDRQNEIARGLGVPSNEVTIWEPHNGKPGRVTWTVPAERDAAHNMIRALGPRFSAGLNLRTRDEGGKARKRAMYSSETAFGRAHAEAKDADAMGWEKYAEKNKLASTAAVKEVKEKTAVRARWEKSNSGTVTIVGSKHPVDVGDPARINELIGTTRDFQRGESLTGGQGEADFAEHAKNMEMSVHDLADILGVDTKTLSLNGRLGIAIGARGKGKAAAHYEPSNKVINITRFAGAGSVAHEWGHFLDNVMAEAHGGANTSSVGVYASQGDGLPGMAPEVSRAFRNVREAMIRPMSLTAELSARKARETRMGELLTEAHGISKKIAEEQRASLKLGGATVKDTSGNDIDLGRQARIHQLMKDHALTKAEFDRVKAIDPAKSDFANHAAVLDDMKQDKYFTRGREMFARAFESWVQDKLESDMGGKRRNTYLVDSTKEMHMTLYPMPDGTPAQPYPRNAERLRLNAAFDDLFSALRSSGALKKALLFTGGLGITVPFDGAGDGPAEVLEKGGTVYTGPRGGQYSNPEHTKSWTPDQKHATFMADGADQPEGGAAPTHEHHARAARLHLLAEKQHYLDKNPGQAQVHADAARKHHQEAEKLNPNAPRTPQRVKTTAEGMAQVRATMDATVGLGDKPLRKSGGPFIGPRGGKWADAQHTVAWDDNTHGPATKPALMKVHIHEKIAGEPGGRDVDYHVTDVDEHHVMASRHEDGKYGAVMPRESLKHFQNDLAGKVELTHSGNPDIDAVSSGNAKFLGKGDDGMAFKVGDKVVKVSTTVPYNPDNPGHRTPDGAMEMMRKQVEVGNKLADLGIPGIQRSKFESHGDKGFQIKPWVEIPEKFTPEQLDKIQATVLAVHKAGYAIHDQIQPGLDEHGEPVMFDIGKAAPLPTEGGNSRKWAIEDDIDQLSGLYRKSGVPFVRKDKGLADQEWEKTLNRVREPKSADNAHNHASWLASKVNEAAKLKYHAPDADKDVMSWHHADALHDVWHNHGPISQKELDNAKKLMNPEDHGMLAGFDKERVQKSVTLQATPIPAWQGAVINEADGNVTTGSGINLQADGGPDHHRPIPPTGFAEEMRDWLLSGSPRTSTISRDPHVYETGARQRLVVPIDLDQGVMATAKDPPEDTLMNQSDVQRLTWQNTLVPRNYGNPGWAGVGSRYLADEGPRPVVQVGPMPEKPEDAERDLEPRVVVTMDVDGHAVTTEQDLE